VPHYTTDDQVKISYRVEGEGDLPTLMIHGWMMNGRVYDDVLARLDRRGRRFIIPDLRGAGDSDKPATGYTLERYARDLIGLMESVTDGHYAVIGHSMGGQLAQLIAATVPDRVRGVAALCPVPASGIPLPPDAQGLFRNASSAEPQGIILGLACKELSDDAKARLLGLGATVAAECIAESFDAWTGGGFADRLGQISAPTLVVATDDPFLPPDFLRAAVVDPISGARMAVIPGPGHYVQVERPVETAAVLEAFLAGLGGGAGASAAS